MEIKSLYYIVRKVIVPKYPWIDDVVWTQSYYDGYENYTLEITPKEGFRESEVYVDKYETEIENEMKSLFKMLNPLEYQRFDRVVIL